VPNVLSPSFFFSRRRCRLLLLLDFPQRLSCGFRFLFFFGRPGNSDARIATKPDKKKDVAKKMRIRQKKSNAKAPLNISTAIRRVRKKNSVKKLKIPKKGRSIATPLGFFSSSFSHFENKFTSDFFFGSPSVS